MHNMFYTFKYSIAMWPTEFVARFLIFYLKQRKKLYFVSAFKKNFAPQDRLSLEFEN